MVVVFHTSFEINILYITKVEALKPLKSILRAIQSGYDNSINKEDQIDKNQRFVNLYNQTFLNHLSLVSFTASGIQYTKRHGKLQNTIRHKPHCTPLYFFCDRALLLLVGSLQFIFIVFAENAGQHLHELSVQRRGGVIYDCQVHKWMGSF